jgi:hypothetical protein
MSTPLLSVIIPTRNRSSYAIPTVQNVLSIPSESLQVVVQDNSDADDLETWARGITDSRLVYSRVAEPLDVVANFSAGMASAQAEYVTFLGDDDGLNPEVADAALWAREHDVDVLLDGLAARYYWPDQEFRYYGKASAGSLELRSFGGRVSWPSPAHELARCARAGGVRFFDLPRAYYGLVKRTCLETVRRQAGSYFPGPSPDLASSVALAASVSRVCKVDYPLFIPGTGRRSTGGLGAMKQHIGRLEDWPHLPQESVRKWSPIVPRFFSGPTIWAEDYVQAATAMGRTDLLNDLNLGLLHAICLVGNPQFTPLILRNLFPALHHCGQSVIRGILDLLVGYCLQWKDRGVSVLRHAAVHAQVLGFKRIGGVTNIFDAVQVHSAYLRQAGLKFRDCVGK